MGISYSKRGVSIDDPLKFATTISSAALVTYLLLPPVSTNEPTISVPFSELWNSLDNGVEVVSVMPQGREGVEPVAMWRKHGKDQKWLSSEIPPETSGLLASKILNSKSSVRFFSESARIRGQMAAASLLGELLGWTATLAATAILFKFLTPNNSTPAPRSISDMHTRKFSDIAGLEKTKTELQEIVCFLKSPESFSALGALPPRGVLLEGPSGTGKTLLGRAVAGEAGVPFFYVPASSFVEVFVGQGAGRIRELFKEARANAPCVLFIDELDAIGMRRAGGAASQEYVQTINQLLVELDGMSGTGKDIVTVLAATNRFDTLDEALVRAGRFDRVIHVDFPDQLARQAAFQIHGRKVKLAESVDFARLASLTIGWTGADINACVNSAALEAARSGEAEVSTVRLVRVVGAMNKERARRNQSQPSEGFDVESIIEYLSSRGPKVTAAD